MRKIDRNFVPRPERLTSRNLEPQTEAMRRHYRIDRSDRMRQRAPYDPDILADVGVIRAVEELCARKCAYCEQQLSAFEQHVRHHRPLSNAASTSDGKHSPDHYSWLAYHWKNLLLVCDECDRHKRHLFPVRAERRALPMATWTETCKTEDALLLDPTVDDAVPHIGFTMQGEAYALSERGTVTIETLALNRDNLCHSRNEVIALIPIWLKPAPTSTNSPQKYRWQSPDRFNESSPHYGAVRIVLLELCKRAGIPGVVRYLLARTGIGAILDHLREIDQQVLATAQDSMQDPPASHAPTAGRKRPKSRDERREQPFLTDITINNFKGIDELKMTLSPPGGQGAGATMLLGENATGKSSVLQAIAIALMSEAHVGRLRLDPEDFVSRAKGNWQFDGSKRMSVQLRFADGDSVDLSYSDDGNRFVVDGARDVTILAYGARRIFQANVAGTPNRSLFNPMAALPDPSPWLHGLDDEQFDAVARAIRPILALRDEDRILRHDGVVLVQAHGRTSPIEHMSEGYRSLFGMVSDIMRNMLMVSSNLEYARGIVLIDEIETHLHPRWKMRVMSTLRKAMPHVQYIATTHDPLCLRGMRNGEIQLMYRDERNHVALFNKLPDIELLRIEQILTSDYFGLFSTAEPEQDRVLYELSTLAQRGDSELRPDQRAQRDALLER